jgi:hypothetical protein
MSEATCVTPTPSPATGVTDPGGPSEVPDAVRTEDLGAAEGWQALALAVLDRELTGPEVAAAERLPVDVALDLFFPDLDDAARHEALWALDRPPA